MVSSKIYSLTIKKVKITGFFCLLFSAPLAFSSNLEQQRELYHEAIQAIENKELKKFNQLKKKLKNYSLYPYLEYRRILLDLDEMPYKAVKAFEKKYAKLPFSDNVKSRYLTVLANKKRWKTYIKYQKQAPISEEHQCNYYYAHSQVGKKKLAMEGAKKLYLSGGNISASCNKLFDVLEKKGKLTDDLILERMLLVFERGNKRLLSYLSNQLSSQNLHISNLILSLFNNPEKVIETLQNKKLNHYQRQLARLAFNRLVKKDPKDAVARIQDFFETFDYKQRQRQDLAEYVINFIMSTEDEDLAIWRDKWLSKSKNQSLLERRFRVALIANNWQHMAHWLNQMPLHEQKTVKWRFWRARLHMNNGDNETANALFRSILGQRDFYSVAAAMYLDEDINFPFKSARLSSSLLKPFKKELKRVSELYEINKISDSRNEWKHILERADAEQKATLAAYASDQDWYAHSVQATISGQLWEHIEFRFPVAHRWFFEHFSKKNKLSVTTLLALSRQESGFYSSAVSPVGARGLMQLMPATARETSKKLGLKYLGAETLSDPAVNIRLGSSYLRLLLDRFDENRILAFAAYNAGPHRVSKWLERSRGNLDVISFIEGIPFKETRGYVQNVLMFEIYYKKLLGMPMQFLYETELAYNY